MHRDLQRMGGIAAWIEAASFLFGIALFVTLLEPYGSGELEPVELVGFMADHQDLLVLWNQVIYILFGVMLVPLTLALHRRLDGESDPLVAIASSFGLIWSGLVIASGMVFNIGLERVVDILETDPERAGVVWQSISAVQDGLGGGNEIVGGLWVLLLSWAALRGGQLPRALSYLGLLIGVLGAITIIPGLSGLGFGFGLGSILWFAWLGFVLLASSEPQASKGA